MARAGSQARAWRVAWSAEALSIAPQRGAHSSPLRPSFGGLRASLAASRPRLWRSTAGGATPPRPPGLRPLCRLRGTGTRYLSIKQEGFGCPVSRGVLKKSWAVRSAAGGSGGVPPVVGRRWATRPRRWAARVQPQAVPAVHGLGEVVHGRPGSGRSGSSEQSNRANIFSFAQPTRAKPRQYWVSREPLYKKIGDPDCTTLCNLTTKMQSKQQLSTF